VRRGCTWWWELGDEERVPLSPFLAFQAHCPAPSAQFKPTRHAQPPFSGLRELLAHLNIAATTARSLVTHMEALCEDFGALGRNLGTMARFEEASSQKFGQYTPRCRGGEGGVRKALGPS
jgi:hypothetical protein